MSVLKIEESTNLEARCKDLLNDPKIRFVGVINSLGNLIAGGFKKGIRPFENREKCQMLYMQMVLEISMRREFDQSLGKVNYTVSSRDKALMISIPANKHVILISEIGRASCRERV